MIPAVKNLTLEDLVHPKVDTPKMIPNRATLLTSLAIKRDTKMQWATELINSAERELLREINTKIELSNAKESGEMSKDITEETPLRKEPVDTTESIGATITKMMKTLGLDMWERT